MGWYSSVYGTKITKKLKKKSLRRNGYFFHGRILLLSGVHALKKEIPSN